MKKNSKITERKNKKRKKKHWIKDWRRRRRHSWMIQKKFHTNIFLGHLQILYPFYAHLIIQKKLHTQYLKTQTSFLTLTFKFWGEENGIWLINFRVHSLIGFEILKRVGQWFGSNLGKFLVSNRSWFCFWVFFLFGFAIIP